MRLFSLGVWPLLLRFRSASRPGSPAAPDAEDQPGHVFTSPADARLAGAPYFVDFRARRGALFGHTFIVYGRLDANGEPLGAEYAGTIRPMARSA